MLLTAGERMSAALLAMAINDLGATARSFTGSQAGVITTGTHGDARIIDITPGRIVNALDRRRHRHRGRLPGRVPDHQGRHHAGTRRLRHHSGRPRRRAEGVLLRDLLRRGRCLHRRSPDRSRRAPDPGRSGTRTCSRWPPTAPRSCTCAAWSTPAARTCRCTSARRSRDKPGTWVKDINYEEMGMEQPLITGIAHDRSEAKITIVGVPDRVGEAAEHLQHRGRRRRQHRHDRAERLPRARAGHRHLLHARPAGRRTRRSPPCARRRNGSASSTCSTTTRSARCRWSASACGRIPGVTARFFRALADGGREHRDDLHLRDPDLGRRRHRRRRPGRPRRPHRVRSGLRRAGRRLRRHRR